MIGNETKVFRLFLLAFLLLSSLFACKDLFGPLDNPVDRESENYQGYDTILNADDIKIFYPANSRIAGSQTTFIVSEVRGASAYQIQISSSQSDFENNILLKNSDYASNKIDIGLQSLTRGIWYYWRARAQQSGEWGKWTEISSFIIGYTITYNGNGNTEGSVPIDSNIYLEGESAIVAKRSGSLIKAGYGFDSWNTRSDGTGINLRAGSTLVVSQENITLYAIWHLLSLWAIGCNNYGQLCDGTTTNRYIPIEVMEDVKAVAAGEEHTMILKNDGSLWAVGRNSEGQLGDGETNRRPTPIKVMDDVQAVSVGRYHTMILKNDGRLFATGDNFYSQLCDGTNITRYIPIEVMEDVKAVAAGWTQTMILKNDGSSWAAGMGWDDMDYNGAGYGPMKPIKVMDDVKEIEPGQDSYSMILKNDGSLWGRGGNYHGQLGDGTTHDRSSPVKVMDNVKAVAAGFEHTMILKNDSSLWATGSNEYGQLGDGTTHDRSSPVKVMDDVKAVAIGAYFTMILKNDSSLWATGSNEYGQLGDGTTTTRYLPIKIIEDVEDIKAGYDYALILK
ncbi:MAG TPA: InlB B-repeat-containing protein [Rectinema sp.]|jgi:uncharacterized repeat protein (TIGR02543 family)|nr:InlB B-repeat-containing protein [Rectinema sp.]HQE68404.1 InlB B-repeat-containing protein [Rectinema sp.]HQK10136.1 InlB B-repeat-containing protein [Rectinema sp.]HRR37377.1 InlB B-repeat-containing protein [Rectinema sp.]